MIDYQSIISAIDAEFGHPTPLRAIVAGFFVSLGATQFFKMRPRLGALEDDAYRKLVRAFAFVVGALPTWLLWPEKGLVGPVMAVVVGIASPILYRMIVAIIGRFSQTVADAISGRPDVRPPAPPTPPDNSGKSTS